jgi:ABC-type glycerol-3-phosphate transport system substrate-binding protein
MAPSHRPARRSAGKLSRRRLLALTLAAPALPLVHIRTVGAAGKLAVGLEDHWAANVVMRRLVEQWAEHNKVELQLDFITSVGNKSLLTLAAEAQSKHGHDIRAFFLWAVRQYANQLIPMDDIVGRLSDKYGKPPSTCEYLGKVDGTWRAVPTASMSKHMVSCARSDVLRAHCGIDPQVMYPARPVHTPESDQWTWDNFLVAAEKCQQAGMPFGLAISNNGDAVDWVGCLFAAFGAQLMDADGNITVRSDPVRAVLDYAAKLTRFLPEGVYGWDGSSNNRALISGKSALIFDAPSAWSVARKDAPEVARNCWGFPNPAGSAGRFVPYNSQYWGVWDFAPNKSAAKDLIEFLSQREQVEQTVTASNGYDIPPFPAMTDFRVWETIGPPTGVWYNYPIKPFHNSQPSVAAWPAPPEIAVRIYQSGLMPLMIARMALSHQTVEQTITWAERELEGYKDRG